MNERVLALRFEGPRAPPLIIHLPRLDGRRTGSVFWLAMSRGSQPSRGQIARRKERKEARGEDKPSRQAANSRQQVSIPQAAIHGRLFGSLIAVLLFVAYLSARVVTAPPEITPQDQAATAAAAKMAAFRARAASSMPGNGTKEAQDESDRAKAPTDAVHSKADVRTVAKKKAAAEKAAAAKRRAEAKAAAARAADDKAAAQRAERAARKVERVEREKSAADAKARAKAGSIAKRMEAQAVQKNADASAIDRATAAATAAVEKATAPAVEVASNANYTLGDVESLASDLPKPKDREGDPSGSLWRGLKAAAAKAFKRTPKAVKVQAERPLD